MGLPSGSLLLAGGAYYFGEWKNLRRIWLLNNNVWSKIGDLLEVN